MTDKRSYTLNDMWNDALDEDSKKMFTDAEINRLKILFYTGARFMLSANEYWQRNSATKEAYIETMKGYRQECIEINGKVHEEIEHKKPSLKIVK